MPNYRADIEYDGTDFHGWQVQPAQRTVQGELQRVLETWSGQSVRVVGAGRTDAGVHALGQVASFTIEKAFETRALLRALHALLPRDMAVRRLSVAPDDWSARWSAVSRHYRYQMLRVSSPLLRRTHYELLRPVDPEPMAEAARLLLGEHDFTAVAAAHSAQPHPFCTVLQADVRANADTVYFEVAANRFLHNMVRRLSGMLVEIGRGRLPSAALRDILEGRDRSRGGPCLPACGLLLVEVRYPEETRPESGAVVDADVR